MAGPSTGPSNSANRFASLAAGYGSTAWQTASGTARTPVARAGTFSKLRVRIPSALTGAQTYTLTLLVNGSASALTCTVDSSGLTASDLTHTVSVSLGDDVCWQLTPANTPTTQTVIQVSCMFEGTDSGKGVIFAGHGSTSSAGWLQPSAWLGGGVSATEAPARGVVAAAGTISRIYARRNTAPGAGTSVTYTVRVNGVDSDVSCTISDTGQTANDTGTATFAAGDTLTFGVTVSGSPAASTGAIGVDWSPTVDGNAVRFDVWSASPSASVAAYGNASGRQNAGIAAANEADSYNLAPDAFTAKNLYVLCDTAPGSGKSRAFTMRKGGAGTALTCTAADANTTANDTTHTISLAAGDLFNIETTPSGTPSTSATVHVGWVAFTGTAPSAANHNGLLLRGAG